MGLGLGLGLGLGFGFGFGLGLGLGLGLALGLGLGLEMSIMVNAHASIIFQAVLLQTKRCRECTSSSEIVVYPVCHRWRTMSACRWRHCVMSSSMSMSF